MILVLPRIAQVVGDEEAVFRCIAIIGTICAIDRDIVTNVPGVLTSLDLAVTTYPNSVAIRECAIEIRSILS